MSRTAIVLSDRRRKIWLTALFVFFPAARALPSDYAGAEACRACHAAEYQAQSATAHARALAPSHPPQPGDWAFGAGEQAITFVRRLDREHYLEEGKSWYRSLGGFARTPGHLTTAGVRDRIFDPAATILRCFACHSTGPLAISGEQAIVPHELGVRCESCHGPAAAHARNPAMAPAPVDIGGVCGQCHRVAVTGAGTPNLRDPWNARQESLMLAASACFVKSQGRLSCVTCHSPHAPLERKPAAYDSFCAKCHASPQHKTQTASRACSECHMPAFQAQPYLRFANHRIGVYAPADALSPISARRVSSAAPRPGP